MALFFRDITTIRDDSQQTIFYNNSVVSPSQDFTYDALYRLVRSEGREAVGLATFGSEDNYSDSAWMESTPLPSNTSAVQRYIQKYGYDKAGNIIQLQHIADSGSYTRDFSMDSASNRLNGTAVGSDSYGYSHDARGNMSTMPHLTAMDYDSLNQMSYVDNANVKAYYQYSGGQRIRKQTYKTASEERIYLGSFERYRKYDPVTNAVVLERTTVHVSDDSGRIGMLEVRTAGSDGSPASLKRFIYSNHLQSAALELDESGAVISYEEYHPYGTTAYQAMDSTINAVAKRYRFTGKERDEESGLSYHGARYYIPWLCRWAAVDPLESKYAPFSPYAYVHDNPVNNTDSTGMGDDENDKKGNWHANSKTHTYEWDKDNSVNQYNDAHPGAGAFKQYHNVWNKGLETEQHVDYNSDGTHSEAWPNAKKNSYTASVHTTPHRAVRHKAISPPLASSTGIGIKMPGVNKPAIHSSQAVENHGIGISWGGVADVVDKVTDYLPGSGIKDVYKGIRDGNYWQVALGAGVLFLTSLL